ncbi:hypothetical protein [Anaerolinea thermophila]|uniref:hypothetical protein n=1 Tax=Anaerolinea thermophila TaxID=167964 RepID=UPI0026EE82C2|nr:hypothetical protein [Anaerolinea thermophila]
MNLPRKTFWLWLMLSVGVAVLLTVIFRQQIRAYLVEPLSYVIWYAQLIIHTVPQPLFWAVMILGGMYLIGKAVLEGLPSSEQLSEPRDGVASMSRYRYWLWYFGAFSRNRFASENLARHLAHLVIEIVGYQEHLTSEEVEKKIREGTLNLPEEVLTFLRTRRLTAPEHPTNTPKVWIERLRARLFQPPGTISSSNQEETIYRLKEVVTFIEERIGGSN